MLSTGTEGSSGLRKPQGGLLNTARGQEGQEAPREEGEMRPDKNSEDEVIRQLSGGKAPTAGGTEHAKGQIWYAVSAQGISSG